MKDALLDSGEGKEHPPAAAAAAHSEPLSYRYSAFQFVLALVYLAFVLYVTAVYTHGWLQRLQMLPLCIVAVIAPTFWATKIRKRHG